MILRSFPLIQTKEKVKTKKSSVGTAYEDESEGRYDSGSGDND